MTSRLRFDLHGALRQLPGLPGTVTGALAAIREDDGCSDRAADLILRDGDFAARVLQMLNSPFYGTGDAVESVRSACLGLDATTLERAMVAASVIGQFPHAGNERFDRFAFWEHSIGVAVIAQTLARTLGENAERGFTAGLLHDLGRLILDSYFPRDFSAVLGYRRRHDTWIRDAEVAVLGFDHCVLGARVAEQWAFPEDLIEAIRHHHQPESDDVQHEVTRIVHIADILVRGLEFGDPGDDAMPLLSQTAMKRLGLNWQGLREALRAADPLLPQARQLMRASLGAQDTATA